MTKRFSLPRLMHLKCQEEFVSLLRGKDTNKISTAMFVLFFRLNELPYPRLGVVASKKNFPTAVLRNKLKRIARESFRLHREKMRNFDIVVMFYRQAKQADKKILQVQLGASWAKIGDSKLKAGLRAPLTI